MSVFQQLRKILTTRLDFSPYHDCCLYWYGSNKTTDQSTDNWSYRVLCPIGTGKPSWTRFWVVQTAKDWFKMLMCVTTTS